MALRIITTESITREMMNEWETYVKVAPVIATQIDEDFEVHTLEGVMQAKAGDWLCMGPAGDIWPVKKEIFEDTYALPGTPATDWFSKARRRSPK